MDTAPVSDRSEIASFRCRNCGRHIGVFNQTALAIGSVIFHRYITFTCSGCGRQQTWSPDRAPDKKKPLDKPCSP